MNDSVPEVRVAQVIKVEYSSSISIVTFTFGNLTFTLYGDRRMTEPIEAYCNKLVRLSILHSADWSWEPLEDLHDAEELE